MRSMLSGCCVLWLASVCGAAETVTIDTPQSGWRNSQGDKTGFKQEVHYPASSVSVSDGQPQSALIRGHIANSQKPKVDKKTEQADSPSQPATLIVNGVAMPMRVEGDGSFMRPYAFGSGSNSVEVRSATGAKARTQFYDNYTGKTQSRLRVVLSWDSDNTDLDLHVVSPDGGHCFYGDRELANGGVLDVDVTTGYGPEIFATPNPLAGMYLVYVNYYGAGDSNQDLTVARVAIITNENTPDEKIETVDIPMRKAGELTLVRQFVYP